MTNLPSTSIPPPNEPLPEDRVISKKLMFILIGFGLFVLLVTIGLGSFLIHRLTQSPSETKPAADVQIRDAEESPDQPAKDENSAGDASYSALRGMHILMRAINDSIRENETIPDSLPMVQQYIKPSVAAPIALGQPLNGRFVFKYLVGQNEEGEKVGGLYAIPTESGGETDFYYSSTEVWPDIYRVSSADISEPDYLLFAKELEDPAMAIWRKIKQ